MRLPPLRYVRAHSAHEAVRVLAEDEDAKVLAGGQSLVPLMAMRLARPSTVVDLSRVPGLDELTFGADGTLQIGARVTQSDVLRSETVRSRHGLACEVTQHVAHEAIRNRGTVAGSVAHADPAAEWPALLTLLGGHVVTQGQDGPRRRAVEDLFLAPFMTALDPDEIVTHLELPTLRAGDGGAMYEVTRRRGDFALAGGMATVRRRGNEIKSARFVLFGLLPKPVRLSALEAALEGVRVPDLATFDFAAYLPPDESYAADDHVPLGLRQRLARTVSARAVSAACERAEA